MKVRTGFVSNSSASSFVVSLFDSWIKDKTRLISEETEKLLLEKGFKYTIYSEVGIQMRDSSDEEWGKDEPLWKIADEDGEFEMLATNLGFWVPCNEDWIYRWLIDNKIPFKSVRHYSHFMLAWDGKEDFVVEMTNWGLSRSEKVWEDGEFKMENIEKMTEDMRPLVKKIPLTHWTEDDFLKE